MGLLTKALEKRFSAANIGILKAVFRLHEEGSPLVRTVRIYMPDETYREIVKRGWYEERGGDRRQGERRNTDRRQGIDRRAGERQGS